MDAYGEVIQITLIIYNTKNQNQNKYLREFNLEDHDKALNI